MVMLTAAALAGFAANSLLTRLALTTGAIDAWSFMMVRFAAGAITLTVLSGSRAAWSAGSWLSAATLAVYGVTFTVAYLRLDASLGALLLFGSVQAAMIGWGVLKGERPQPFDWLGLALAIAGLLVLTAPGLSAPDPAAAVSMVVAGLTWGIYSLHGRSSRSPVAMSAGNFIRTLPLAAVLGLPAVSTVSLTSYGLLLGVVCGALTTGLAYAAWYAALPRLTAWRASLLQLCVPVLAALGAVVFLGEAISLRVWLAGAAIGGGVLLSLGRTRPPPPAGVPRRRF
jgi:drug/metabolite transporter (DMT)-like permease